MFLGKIVFIIKTLCCVTLGCHSKVNQKVEKEKINDCSLKNVTNFYGIPYSGSNETTNYFPEKRIRFFNASKPNIASLPCYDFNIRLFEISNEPIIWTEDWKGTTAKYLNNISRFTNSPMQCQAYCQGDKFCRFFTFKVETNQCWFFTRIEYAKRKFKEEGYISGPEYCETTHPVSKGGFQIQVYKPWLRFNDTFVWRDIPTMTTHAWESCSKTCSANKNCTSFDYCFLTETDSNEMFQCYMKSNTFAETLIKTPEHCVKSVKQNCSLV